MIKSLKYFFTTILLFFAGLFFSYSQTITGIVSDINNISLENANVIAKPLHANANLKFAIADNKGRYRLELEKDIKYEITVSYIGFIQETFVSDENTKTHDFKLQPTGETLKEIVIKHEFVPIEIKKDTVTYDVKSFANGSERKMKEILEKLPGVEVDKNGIVRVQGKKVTKMLVEGKSFFGGGSKLAVENIPADALDKIEVIDNFNEVGFMKQVSDSDDLAMNVKLKANKKKFVFGDLETGSGIGFTKNHLAHASLFYYAPKTNLSFIGDVNDIGKSTFTFEDLMRFGGGFSSFLSSRKPLTDLFSFTNNNNEVVKNKTQFAALNYSFEVAPKLTISGFSIFSKILTNSQIENKNTFLQNSIVDFENKLQNGSKESVLGIGNVKLDYSPNKKEKCFYNAQYQSTNNDLLNTINSTTNINSNVFETISKADNNSIKQYLEWHKSYNLHHTATFVVNHSLDINKPINQWLTNQPFLAGLIPLQNDVSYNIQQLKKVQNNTVDALFKHYWIINNLNHLYTNIGNNFTKSNLETSEKQILSNGNNNDFDNSGFGNKVKYQLNDFYIGLEYKFKIGKWTNKPGLYLHFYDLQTNQITDNYSIQKTLLQPQFNSDYEFSASEKLNFSYKLSNDFPDANKLSNRYTLQYYNSVFKGNAILENEKFHSANLRYSKMNMYRGIFWNANANFNKKVKTIRNEVILNGINQFTTPILTNNPETNISFNGTFSKKIYRIKLELNPEMTWFTYYQNLNNIESINNQKFQKIGLLLKTAYRKWPSFSIEYKKGFSQFEGITNAKYKTDAIISDLELSFLKSWTFKCNYENLKNTNNNNQTNFFEIANTSLRYQKKNSPIGFELIANNVFDIQKKNDFSFSDYFILEQSTFVLPRILMLSISYKL
jgi:ribosomal protein S6